MLNTAFTETIGALWRSIFWIIFFLPFLYFERINFGLLSTTLQRGCNHRILRVHRNVMRKNKKRFFEKSISFLSFLETARKVSAGWSTLHLPRQKDLYADQFFDLYVSLKFLYTEGKIFGLSSKTLRGSCNHCILRVHHNVLRKNKNWILRKKYKFFKFLGDCKESFGGVVNTAFTVTIGTSCRSVFFCFSFFSAVFYFQGNIFCLSLKTPRRGCNHCILRVHRNVLRKNKNLIFQKT